MSAEIQDDVLQQLLASARSLEPELLPEPPPLSHLNSSTPTATLLSSLDSDTEQERGEAAALLGQRGEVSALERLKQLAAEDTADVVRQKAALAVLQLGGEELLAEVAKHLRDDDPGAVAHAAITLGKVGNPVVVPNLLQAFQTESAEIGAAVAWALGQLKDNRAIEWLSTSLKHGFVSANAAEALGEIGTPEVVPILLQTLQHPNQEARAYAARGLGRIQQPESLKGVRAHLWFQTREDILLGLQDALEQEEQPMKVKIAAAVALHEQGDRHGGEALLRLLSESKAMNS